LSYVKLTEFIAVAGQIMPEHAAQIAEAGYRVLINNRPDCEEAGQPGAADIGAAARAAGLEYYHLPVTAADFPGPDVEEMARLLGDESKPVFAFCRSGTRCTNLWVATRDPAEREQAMRHAQGLGFDLSMAKRLKQ
jgi:uncharacterized protein (TIGR01244 family)